MGAAAGTLRYHVLGPFEVVDAVGAPVVLPGVLQRRLVAALLLRHGRVVPVDVLADRLWGEAGLPEDVAGSVQTHVSRTRRLLGEGGATVLVTDSGGYRLDAAPESVDGHRFDRLVSAAIDVRAADPAGAVACLDEWTWRGAVAGRGGRAAVTAAPRQRHASARVERRRHEHRHPDPAHPTDPVSCRGARRGLPG